MKLKEELQKARENLADALVAQYNTPEIKAAQEALGQAKARARVASMPKVLELESAVRSLEDEVEKELSQKHSEIPQPVR